MRRAGALPAAALAAAGCAGKALAPTPSGLPPVRVVVEVAGAAAAFQEICLDHAPAFAGSEAAMPRHGLTRRAGTGTVYHFTGTLSAKVATATTESGIPVHRCSVVHEDDDSAAAEAEVARLVARLGPALGARETRRFRAANGAVKTGTVWQVTLAGQRGEMGYLPQTDALPVGTFLIEFPVMPEPPKPPKVGA